MKPIKLSQRSSFYGIKLNPNQVNRQQCKRKRSDIWQFIITGCLLILVAMLCLTFSHKGEGEGTFIFNLSVKDWLVLETEIDKKAVDDHQNQRFEHRGYPLST
jgi:hypothetical protein